MFAQHTTKHIENTTPQITKIKCEKTGTIYYKKDTQQAWSRKDLIKSVEKPKK